MNAEKARVLAVDGGLGGQVFQRRRDNGMAGQHLRHVPRVQVLADGCGSRQPCLDGVEVGGRDDRGGWRLPLPEHGEIDAEESADAAERVADLAVHVVGRQVDEPRGQVGQQGFELEMPFERLARMT